MTSEGSRPLRRLMFYARRAVGMTQRQLGDELGVSHRTVLRWERGYSSPVPRQILAIAAMLRPDDDALADELLATGHMNIIVSTAPAPAVTTAASAVAAPAPEGVATKPAIDAVVFAAAEAMDASPRAVRVGLAAAFARAVELGLAADAVAAALSATVQAAPAAH